MSCDADETIPINKNYPGKYKNFLEDKYNFVDACEEKVGTTDFNHINENLNGTYSFEHLFDVADNFSFFWICRCKSTLWSSCFLKV